MNLGTNIIRIFLFSLVFYGCGDKANKNDSQVENTKAHELDKAPKMEITINDAYIANSTAKIGIEGMMCPDGCAAFIQENLGNTNGIASCKVAFAENTAYVDFDDEIISEKEIINLIESYNNSTYKVTEIEVEKKAIKELN